MKWTKTQTKQLCEFVSKSVDCCVPVDEWTSGEGRYTKPRALPPFVHRVERGAYDGLPFCVQRCAMRFFAQNPRRKAVYVLDNEEFAAVACGIMREYDI